MYVAELHGKLPLRLEQAEDILTSNVFSFFKYCNRPAFLHPYLDMLGFRVSVADVMSAEFSFWPRFSENTEPDVVIRTGGHYILFESKYRSGFGEGNAETKAQLVREIEGGMLEANNNGERFSLVAITADYYYKQNKFACLSQCQIEAFHWTNWQKVAVLIERVLESDHLLTWPERGFAEDLYNLLCKKNLREYRGMGAFEGFDYHPHSFNTVFLDAATTSFRGDFIGFSQSLSNEATLTAPAPTIFLELGIGRARPSGGSAHRSKKNSRSERPSERGLFANFDLTGIDGIVDDPVFFGSKPHGEQKTHG